MKICSHCKQEKLLLAFSRDRSTKDGLQCQCKGCKVDYRQSHKAEIAEQKRGYCQAHKAEIAQLDRAYRQTFAGKETRRRAREKFPEKTKAHAKVCHAIAVGVLERPTTCESCGLPAETEGHREDYDKPLDVDWLCRKCHKELHRKEKT